VSCQAAGRLTLTSLCCAAALIAALVAPPAGALAQSRPSLDVRAAVLVDPDTGQTLDAISQNRELPIASTTKLMTALITLEHVHRLGTMFTNPNVETASADSQIGLAPGERMSVHDLLLALMLPSADDAAADLAYNVGDGSVSRFVGMMNARARQLGLRHTHYSTPSGLDTPGNYSSAADLVRLADYDMTHSRYFARIVALRSAVLRSGDQVRYVVNRNDLVGEFPWIDGVKTGHTNDAGYVLVAAGQRDGMTLLSAVLGTDSEGARDANTLALLNYGFANFQFDTPIRAGEVLARPTVRDRPGVRVPVAAARSFTRVLARQTRLATEIHVARQLVGPLPSQAVVGTAVVLADGRPIARIPLLLRRALPAVSGLTVAARFITKPLMLLVIALALALCTMAATVARRRRRTRAPGRKLEAA
jgi:D-alanyl-D-alanine carboxypeptidase (penicillin-binding protein 5/6)